jgi:hypothetical protein
VTAHDVFEAELVRGLLENASVPVVLDAFDRSPFAWMYPAGNVQRPVQVFVPAPLLETARLELLESSVVAAGRFAQAAATDTAASRPLLRDKVRPLYVLVAVLTSITVGWFVVVEVLGFAPCVARVMCLDQERGDGIGQCGRSGATAQGGGVCATNP